MPWFKVDDKLHSHPKARRVGLPAMGLWSMAGSHCMDYLTDGFVEEWFVKAWPDGVRLARRLVAEGMWLEADGGWRFHDWSEYQPTREQVLAEREATRERVSKHRTKRGGNGVTNGVSNGVGTTTPSPVPSPDLTKTSKSQSLDDRASVSTDVSSITVKLAAQNGVTDLAVVKGTILEHTGRTVTLDEAWAVAYSILQKARRFPDAPMRYVAGAIAKSPFEVQQFIDRAGAA